MVPPDTFQGPSRRALLIGLSRVDAAIYGSDMSQGCEGCLHDVEVMQGILAPLGYETSVLTDADASIARVEGQLSAIAATCRAGDVFLLYYTGHGDQLPDQPAGHPDRDEPDGRDECYCLHDGRWRDDSLYRIWLKFPPGAVIYAITDSCRSGSAMRNARPRAADFIQQQDAFPCPLLHIAASRDATVAHGGEDGSELTRNIQRIWNRGGFTGTWADFYLRLDADMPGQALQGNLYGPGLEALRSLRPFSSPS